MHVDDELGRHALLGDVGGGARDRQQRFGLQGAGFALLEELAADVREHGVGQHVLLALGQRADFLAQLVQLGCDPIGRAALDDLLAADGHEAQALAYRRRSLAVAALQVELHLVGDGLVALAGEHVEERLGADDLRGRRDQRRVAEVLAHLRNLGQHFIHAMQRALLLELVGEVGNHPAGHLVDLHAGVDAGEFALELVVLLAHRVEVQADLLQQLEIQAGVVRRVAQRGDHRLGARVAGAPGHRRDRGVDAVGAVLHGLELAHAGDTGGVVRVHHHVQLRQRLLQRLDQRAGGVRREQAGHVLDGDGVDAHRRHLARLLDEGVDGVHGAGGVGDGALGVLAGLLHRTDGGLQVTHVVHRIEDAEHVDAVLRRLGDEGFDHVVAVVAVAEQVLPAQQHLQAGIGQRGLELAQTLPRVFLEEAHAGVERGAAPDFQRPVADAVELVADRQHVFGAHAGRQQRLGVTQDGVGNADFLLSSHGSFLTGLRGRQWQRRWPGPVRPACV
ncbi:hypothetical protein SSTU70S_05481 [Stutzerimonas stutzeri]